MTPPANVRLRFLSWDQPLLPQAVALLAADWPGEGPLDLSSWLVIVPTRQSGRRLREALAALAATRGTAVFPPQVMLPESLLASTEPDVATRLSSLLAWCEVFLDLPLESCRAVFPVDPPERTFTWALRLAREFTRLQHALAEAGLQLADVAPRAGDDFPERERWEQIGALEIQHATRLAARGWRDAHAARIATARAPVLPPGVTRIVVLASPDPQPLALAALRAAAATVPVEVAVFAPADETAAFDAWGRPSAEQWPTRVLALPAFEQRVHLCADAATQAQRVADLAARYAAPEGALAVGIADPDVLPLLEGALTRAGQPAFNPEGRRRAGDALHTLLSALAALAREDSFVVVEALARCPDLLQFLDDQAGGAFSAADFLRRLDKLHTRHLPPTLDEARRHAPQSRELALIAGLRDRLAAEPFPVNVAGVLGELFAARRFDLAQPADARAAEAAEAWSVVMRDVTAAARTFPGVSPADWFDVALQMYAEAVHYDDKPAGALELQGWLELLWEDAPHLVIAGLNDGRVPEAIVGDPFLPEALRERLGMKTNAARLARDAYILQALAACRGASETSGYGDADGRLDLLLGKVSASGDPLRPSRLLLRCEDAALPARVAFLFRPVDAEAAAPSWQRAWRVTPRSVAPPAKVAVTGFRAWLACPFRFLLGRVLRMEAVDPAKTELDVFDFGTLCHAALEAMARAPQLRDCTDAAVVREFLLAALEQEARRRFGTRWTLPLVVQLESARQRLSRAADVQAETRAAGWVVEHVEHAFELDVGGLVVTGKIDRIDRHEVTGRRRVLDYKTSDQPVEPWQAHLRGPGREETPPEFARLVYNARELVWSDLQLPLYLRACGGEAGNVECGYFNLPKAAGETGIRPWLEYTRELDASAWTCALGVSAAIQAGEFWPPKENVPADRDEFAPLFHHGAADSVDWRGPGGAS